MTSSPYRAGAVRDLDVPRWRAATRGAALYAIAVSLRIAAITAAVVWGAAIGDDPRPLRSLLVAVTAAYAATDLAMALGCFRLARLPREWQGGWVPALGMVPCLAAFGVDVADLARLHDFVPTLSPGELSAQVDRWSSLHMASALIAAMQPLLLLVPMARIAYRLSDGALGNRAKLFALYLPIAVISVGVMNALGYGATSILLPAGLPVGGPFGVVTHAVLMVFAALLLQLRGVMARAEPRTHVNERSLPA